MSIFSKIKASKKAAEAHKATEANKQNEVPKPAYRHIPQHAASDAMSGCPQAWVEVNRSKIVAHNQRASQQAKDIAARRREQAVSTSPSIRSAHSERSVGGVSHRSSASRINLESLPKNRSQNAYLRAFPADSMNASVRSSSVGRSVSRNRSTQSVAIGAYSGSSYGSTTRMRRGESYQDSVIGRSPLSTATHSRVNSSGNSTASSEDLEIAMPSSSRPRPALQSRYSPSNAGIKRNTSDPKISSSLRTSVMNSDNLPTTPAPAVVRQGPMPTAPQPQVKEKRRMSLFSNKKGKAVTATA